MTDSESPGRFPAPVPPCLVPPCLVPPCLVPPCLVPPCLVPPCPATAVWLWTIPLDQPPAVITTLESVLDGPERDRSERFTSRADQRRFVVTHGVTRLVLGRVLAMPPSRLRFGLGPHGKPELRGRALAPAFNISHSGDIGLLAMADRRPVGVDVERRQSVRYRRLAHRFFCPADAAAVASAEDDEAAAAVFLRLWTRKEAVVKAAGGRLSQGLTFPVSGDLAQPVHDPRGLIEGSWLLRDVPMDDGYRAALALPGEHPFQVIPRTWQYPDLLSPS